MGQIYDISTFSMLDYPGKMACIVWLAGCNLRCTYCHNPDIVLKRGSLDEAEFYAFLEKRKGKLTAVVFSGGEATFCEALPEYVRTAKDLGFKVKIDTNGSNPAVLKDLIGRGLVDMVALDYKAPPELAGKICGTDRFVAAFYESLDFLIAQNNAGKIDLEIRTTAVPEFLSEENLSWIIGDLGARGYKGIYYIQHMFSSGEKTLGNVPEPKTAIDRSKLAQPQGFALGFRNFPGDAA
ncbi:MAG: anaerobic ribonucleoside-triphosphate reductase activating protein [Alphaproteobacteria bacterium]|nr:anaerobic ribonucleoside-triphosphate reductase activating protein [Alphaproteobacteria bacterium]